VHLFDRVKLAQLSAIRNAGKIFLYRLIGLSAWAERRLDLFLSRRAYRKAFGREPDLRHPVLFTEKVTARKLFERRRIFTTISDKILVRDFVTARIGTQYLTRLYLVCDRFEEIDFDKLPDKFVIKPNHGTHWVSIVEDKKAFDRVAAQKLFRRWMRTSYYVNSREFFYKNIDRRIMVEEFLQEGSGAPAIDYKFYVYDGVPRFLSLSQPLPTGDDVIIAFYDRNLRWLPVQRNFSTNAYTRAKALKKDVPVENPFEGFTFPSNIEEMFGLACELGRGFDFIRADLYDPAGRILFGELTTLPGGGVSSFDPPIYDQIFGQYWNFDPSDSRLTERALPSE
jgi:hypothetical protein